MCTRYTTGITTFHYANINTEETQNDAKTQDDGICWENGHEDNIEAEDDEDDDEDEERDCRMFKEYISQEGEEEVVGMFQEYLSQDCDDGDDMEVDDACE